MITLTGLSSCIRPCIRAPKGYKLVVADLSAIENRVLAWLSGCEEMLDIYRQNRDPYITFATELFNIDYEAVTKTQRQLCKPAVLGCGYGLGGGQEREMVGGQKIKTGLWKYAESMGVHISQKEAQRMVGVFRSAYPDVVFYWTFLEDAFKAACQKSNREKQQQVGAIYFTGTSEAVRVHLPSGRCIHYLNPYASFGGQGTKLSFDGFRNGQWGRISTYGGRLCENIVQAVARDVLAEGLLRAEQAELNPVGHCHDEIICLTSNNWAHDGAEPVEHLVGLMSGPVRWAPGLPLAAEGYESEFYQK